MNSSQIHGTNTTSSLRPRNKRLISIEDGDGLTQHTVDLSSGPRSAPLAVAESSSTFGSRSVSPLNSAFGSRTPSGNRTQQARSQTQSSGSTKKWGLTVPTPTSASFLFSPKYWGDSWSSLQDVATTLLGTDLRDPPRSATLPRSKHGRHASKYGGLAEDEWGPTINIENSIAAGSQEDRIAQIQARKRQALLTANGYNSPDTRGKYKRKLSVDNTEILVTDHSEDALVYVHPVQPSDSVMGIAIRYGCSESIVRKSNRLWANDSIQLKRLAYIPVDACTVRGQKITSPAEILQPLPKSDERDELPPTPNSQSDWSIPDTPKASTHNPIPSPSISTTTTSYDNPGHIHESWVQIAGFPTSTEIARLPRRTLGFFPPARRKSSSYHDTTPSGAGSPIISPSVPPLTGSSIPVSPALFSPASIRSGRPRAGSSAMTPSTIASALRGPGGVGTLGVEARAPGPAQDKLNTFFISHFPNAAIPIVSASPGMLSRRTSFDSLRSGMSTPSGTGGLEQFGGKVETWVRKMAAKGVKELSSSNGGIGGSGRSPSAQLIESEVQGDGDLIELMDGMDLGRNTGIEDISNNKNRLQTQAGMSAMTSMRSDDSEDLRERFPVGGRVFESVKK